MKNRDNIGKNLYLGVFEVADYESIIKFSKFKMAATKMKNRDNISENVHSGVFGVADCESVIRLSKFEMADSRWRCRNEKPRQYW